MTTHPTADLTRFAPDRPFPPYAYLPGKTPHPTRDTDGHSHGAEPETPDAPNPDDWRRSGDYLYGIDLFNHGYYWEAHEAWEGLWVACGREGITATFLQALINLAAVGLKARMGSARGIRANATTAADLFASFERQLKPDTARYMGLDWRLLADHAGTLSSAQPAQEGVRAFPISLRPE